MGRENGHRIYEVLSANLPALRGLLPVDEMAMLGAQLLIQLRGVSYESWDPSQKLEAMDAEELLERVSRQPCFIGLVEAKGVVRTAKRTRIGALNVQTGEEDILGTDAMVVAIGYQPNTAIFQRQLPLDEREYSQSSDPAGTATAVEGVFVAGDVRDYRYRQAVAAAGVGCKAAMDAERWQEAVGV
jgi:thioredoxin reductase